MMNNPIRVLHIFAPNYKKRFGGPIYRWRFYFSKWNNPNVIHLVLDDEKNCLSDSRKAFDFTYDSQKETNRWQRLISIISLIRHLASHKKQYDILHFHALWWRGLLATVWANRVGIPAIYESVLLGADTPGAIIKEPMGRIKIWCLRNFKGILAISDSLSDDYLKNGFQKGKVYTLMNCVDTDLFHPINSHQEKIKLRQKYQLPPDDIIILYAGSLIKRKGVDLLINGFIEAHTQMQNLFLLLIGPKCTNENPTIDPSFINEITRQMTSNKIEGSVKLTGLIQDRQTIANLFRASDLFVFPSRQEGLPNVVLEAMASGLLVLVHRLPGLEKVIENNINGIYILLDDDTYLKDLIIRICKEPGRTAMMRIAARKHVCEKHGFPEWETKMVAIYETLYNRQEIKTA